MWEKANDLPILGENATISDLDEGQEYEFRVAALTNAGVGDYSLNTMPVKVCEKKGRIQLYAFPSTTELLIVLIIFMHKLICICEFLWHRMNSYSSIGSCFCRC